MVSTRVVQITDLHILPEQGQQLEGVDTAASLEKVLHDIKSLSPAAECIIASGDLCDDASEQSYRRLQTYFNTLDCPVYVQAGNHDDIAAIQQYLVNSTIRYVKQLSLANWQILFVDSKAPEASFGFINETEMHWLDSHLSDSDAPTLLSMHHTPLHLCESPFCQVKNAQSLLEMLDQKTQVKALIAGHTHNDIEQQRGHFRIMTTPSTMIQVAHHQPAEADINCGMWEYHEADASRHGYRVLDLYEDGTFDREVLWVAA